MLTAPTSVGLNAYGVIDFIDYETENINRIMQTVGLNSAVPPQTDNYKPHYKELQLVKLQLLFYY